KSCPRNQKFFASCWLDKQETGGDKGISRLSPDQEVLNLLLCKASSSREAPFWGFFVFVVCGHRPHHAGLCGESSKRLNGPCAHFCFLGSCILQSWFESGLKHGFQARIVRANGIPCRRRLGL
ncbi:hypothetical protein, partial [Methylophaga sp. UBA4204]|uniref:hypothetical protein n=1 Tax=Methylophaga sp. UBA4204 TaxID=1946892 RepID=UPI0025D6268E